MSQLIGMLDAARVSANLVREYALDHYVHFGFLPNDVDVDGHVFDYETYNYLIDLWHYATSKSDRKHSTVMIS